jgi:putative SOS response-associated peptidase YedK
MGICEGLSRMSWKLSRTVLRGGVTGNGGSLLDQKAGKEKIPHYIRLRDGDIMSLAGLWERWKSPEGEDLETCTILTTAANSLVKKLHDRMPVILHRAEFDIWLDRDIDDMSRLTELFHPYPSDQLEEDVVTTDVNSLKNDSPDCIIPAEQEM